MIQLREYQLDGERQIREAFAAGFKAPLYVLPCGGGKTFLFSSIAHSAARRGKRVLILSHRIELVDQIVSALEAVGERPDIVAGGYARRAGGRGSRADHYVVVASVQTLVRRLGDVVAPTLIIIDEAHHTSAGSWIKILGAYPKAKILGVTASPIRTDGRGLAAHFDKLIVGPSVTDLTSQGYLAPARIFAPPTVDTSGLRVRMGDFRIEEAEALVDVPAITGDALSHYRKHADGRPALTFCTSVAHAHHVAEQFRRAGYSAAAIDGGTDRAVRRMAVDDFRDGRLQIFSQCDIANEGFDIPGVHCGIFLRPTTSMGLYIQMTGRCCRPAPGKEYAILLDHVNNARRFGMPSEPREWELSDEKPKRRTNANNAVRVCPMCFAASGPRARACVDCGHVFEVKARQDIEEREGELVELTPEEIERKRERQAQGMTKTMADLIAFGKRKGYKNPEVWAAHVQAGRKAKQRKREAI